MSSLQAYRGPFDGVTHVQMHALSLLIALLEGGNSGVQRAIGEYFKSHKRSSFFRVAHETLLDTKHTLRDQKKLLENKLRVRRSYEPFQASSRKSYEFMRGDALDGSLPKPDKSIWNTNIWTGRTMMWLRLLQVLCSGQCASMQNLMFKQSSLAISYNLVRACTTLLEAVQPLASSVNWDKDNTPFFKLQIHLLATLCDMIQGPNIQNQKDILESSALSHVNRMFSSIKYIKFVPRLEADPRAAMTAKHLNSVIALLKWEALKLCLAFFDSVLDPEIPKRMLAFFDVSNFITQMLSTAAVLGLIADSDCKSNAAERIKLCESLHAKGYRERLRTEMLAYYHLLRYFKRYEEVDEVSKKLKLFKYQHPKLYTYLKTHTCIVEISRALCLDKTGVPVTVDKDDGKADKHIEKVFFPVSEHMALLVKSTGFKLQWKKLIWDLPHTKVKLKHSQLVSKMRKTLAMATWLEHVASSDVGSFLIRKREVLRGVQLRLSILITALILIFYGIPIDPNDGEILVGGDFHMGLLARARSPAGYTVSDYPYSNRTSGPLDKGKTKGSVLHYVDESLEFRMHLTSRWSDPAGWRYFPEARYLVYILGLLHMLLSLLRLVAYVVLEFPLTFFAEDSDTEAEQEEVGDEEEADASSRSLRKRLYSTLKAGASAAYTLLLEDEGADAFDVDDNDSRRVQQRQRHGVVAQTQAKKPQNAAKQSEEKDAQDSSQQRVSDIEPAPPPEKGACLQIFGRMLRLLDVKVIKRQWELLYLMSLLSTSLLGIWSSPFYFVVCLLDHFRTRCVGREGFVLFDACCVMHLYLAQKSSDSRMYFCCGDSRGLEGADVFQALYLGAPKLIRSYCFGLIFLVLAGLYTYTYFSQTAIIEDESCHSPFQCVIKHILDGFRGDITTIYGTFMSWTYPPVVMWEELWYQYRTTFVVMTLICYNMLLQPVIQGQIIDSFSQLRGIYKSTLSELENKCFITGLEKEAFDDYPGEWDARKEGEYTIHYLLFLKYLLDKDPADYTGLENDVIDAVKEGDSDFLPLGTFWAKQQRDRESPAENEKSAADAQQQEDLKFELQQLKKQNVETQKQNDEIKQTLATLLQMLRVRSVDLTASADLSASGWHA